MPLPSELGWESANHLLEELDTVIASTAEAMVADRLNNPQRVAQAFREMAKIARRLEPDYGSPGLSVPYALKYLPKRVTSLMGLFDFLEQPPMNILDIGSGSDATAIALSLGYNCSEMHITAVEPSQEMIDFALLLPGGELSGVYYRATLEEIAGGFLREHEVDSVDLIVLSACLQYGIHEQAALLSSVVRLLYNSSVIGASIIVVEPSDKEDLLTLFETAARQSGRYETRRYVGTQVPLHFRQPRRMVGVTALLTRLVGQIDMSSWTTKEREFLVGPSGCAWETDSWNPSREEHYLVCVER